MKILVCHNFYQQPGGEDRVFAEETALLESRGHEVVRFVRHNDELTGASGGGAAAAAVWSAASYRDLRGLILRCRPDIAHFHNTWPLISPSGYYASRRSGVPVVQTLHNYRLLCPNALLFRDGHVCEDCVGKPVAWPGVVHRCYRHSAGASAAVAVMLAVHRARRTWQTQVDLYLALTEFARTKYVAGGLPADRIVVKPHGLTHDPGQGSGRGGYVLYVGRLSAEKGLGTLLAAWRSRPGLPPLRIVGDGPLAGRLSEAGGDSIVSLGRLSPERTAELMGEALCLVMPSECYETFGRVVIEAFAAGTPVIASDGGATAELVEPGRTGLRFRTGDPASLADRVHSLVQDPEGTLRMRGGARAEYEARYTAEASYQALLGIYRRIIGPPTPVPARHGLERRP